MEEAKEGRKKRNKGTDTSKRKGREKKRFKKKQKKGKRAEEDGSYTLFVLPDVICTDMLKYFMYRYIS